MSGLKIELVEIFEKLCWFFWLLEFWKRELFSYLTLNNIVGLWIDKFLG